MMRFWFYCVLTQLIIWLGRARDKLVDAAGVRPQVRHDRTFYAGTMEAWTCCDCGLEHLTHPLFGEEPRERAFRFVPIRIKGYDYRLRYGSGGPSPFVDESGKDPWTGAPRQMRPRGYAFTRPTRNEVVTRGISRSGNPPAAKRHKNAATG